MKTVLVHSPNWLGDVVMALPAWRKWRDAHRDCRVFVLAKKSVAGIWAFARDVDGVVTLAPGGEGMRTAVRELRELKCDEAIVLPHSFRAAYLVWRGGAGGIRGTAGQFRFPFVTDRVSISDLADAHQQLEYARLFGVEGDLPSPAAAIDPVKLPTFECGVPLGESLVILPGAARGGSKRWPWEHFSAVAGCALGAGVVRHVLVCGTPGEAAECAAVAEAVAAGKAGAVTNLCGKTRLGELAFVLSKCRAVCSNDSGGMHLATAMGAPVVAVFGLTDPAKTGPLGRSAVVAAEGVKVSRAIPRESAAATRALLSVKPERVFKALQEVLANG